MSFCAGESYRLASPRSRSLRQLRLRRAPIEFSPEHKQYDYDPKATFSIDYTNLGISEFKCNSGDCFLVAIRISFSSSFNLLLQFLLPFRANPLTRTAMGQRVVNYRHCSRAKLARESISCNKAVDGCDCFSLKLRLKCKNKHRGRASVSEKSANDKSENK